MSSQLGAVHHAARPPYDLDLGSVPELGHGVVYVVNAVGAAATEFVAAIDQTIAAAELASGRPVAEENLHGERAASEAFYRFIGRPCVREALECTVGPTVEAGPKLTLADSAVEARQGNQDAEARVDVAIGSAAAEALFKTKHITHYTKTLTDSGEVVQYGLSGEQIHQDAIVHRSARPAPLKKITLAEVRNGFREQHLAADGTLDDAWMVAASFVPRGVPEEWLDHRGDGYFTDSMTYSLQGSTKKGSKIMVDSIFDAGTAAPEDASFAERQEQRFDLQAYQLVCEWLGVPVPQTELEALESPLIIPKSMMPNGMLDFWRWMDMAADQIQGKVVVRTVEEYLQREQLSREREASIAGLRQTVKDKLLAVDGFDTEGDANAMLWELLREHGYRAAAYNDNIEPGAFGQKGARKLLVAKKLIELGDDDGAGRWIEAGLEDATSTGCGGGACGIREAVTASELSFAESHLDLQEGDSVSVDLIRPCPDCNEVGGVTYVYKGTAKLNIGCNKCHATKIGG